MEVLESKESGRPSLFKTEYTQMLLDYFNQEPYEERVKKVLTKSGDVIEVPFDVAADFPSLAGFAVKIGVHRDTLHEWSKATNEDKTLRYPEFSDAYKRAKDFQENYLLVNGNKGLIPPNFGIFTAKNVIGYRDKQPGEEDKVIVNNLSLKSTEEIEVRARELAQKFISEGKGDA